MQSVHVLLVEDNPGDILLTRKALEQCKMQVNLTVLRDGEEALDHLQDRANKVPDIILLDLNLPKIDGRQVLTSLKHDDRLKAIPIVVLTSSQADEDIAFAYREYCNCYISKPIRMSEFVRIVQTIEDFWFTIVKLPPQEG